VLSRGRATHSVARGAAVLFPACAALAFASGRAVFPLSFLYGLGLGITITSINLLRSQRRADTRIREMNRLNLVWALGAFACPWLANEALYRTSVTFLFLALAAVFAVFTAWALAVETRFFPSEIPRAKQAHAATLRLPLVIAFTTLLATGIESATGAWIVTYAGRLRPGFWVPVAAGSVFWFGLLASRAIHSTPGIQRFSERTLLRVAVPIVALGCTFLLASRSQDTLLLAAFLIGLGVGPVYPVLLAAVLPRVNGNLIFVMAGLGGATFPWLTGTLSARAGSLRTGMMAPAGVGFVMLLLLPSIDNALHAIEQRAQALPEP